MSDGGDRLSSCCHGDIATVMVYPHMLIMLRKGTPLPTKYFSHCLLPLLSLALLANYPPFSQYIDNSNRHWTIYTYRFPSSINNALIVSLFETLLEFTS